MSFEHKYLKYKQKYLELKAELSNLQTGGNEFNFDSDSDDFNVEKLTETPTLQKGGFFNFKKDDSPEEFDEVVALETENSILNHINEISNPPEKPSPDDLDTAVADAQDAVDNAIADASVAADATGDVAAADDATGDVAADATMDNQSGGEEDEDEDEDMNGGEPLDTSISELDEIFSQLGGKKHEEHDEFDLEDSDSDDLSSLSDLEDDDSSDFDL